MCGIAGILGADVKAHVPEMIAALRHRGPDAQATVARANAHVGAARLRIVDLTAGDQPLVSSRTGAVLVFNGEIYNYRELRAHLEARAHRFETNTDSEVVLRAYEEYGWRCVDHLRGMYAFAIVDGEHALLARDPLGIKPLHYCWLRGRRSLAFASEIKSLLCCPEVSARLDESTLGDIQVLEYVADPRATLFEGIHCLEPGTCLDITLSATGLDVRSQTFARAAEPFDPAPSLESAESHLDELLDAAVRSHQMADVPICLTLSGGLDSTLLGLVLRQQAGEGLVSYIVSDDVGHEDVQQAQRMARMLGFEHRPVMFTFDEYLAAMAPSIIASESFTDCGVAQYLLFRELGRHFRVAFNGEGADELFGGYPEHWQAARYAARIRDAPMSMPMTERGAIERERLLSGPAIDSDSWMLDHFLGSQLTDRHLHPLDKFGMSSSVEVRVPYLDHELAAYVRRLPAQLRVNRPLGSLKYILRRVYLRRWKSMQGASGLVDAVLRQKLGFPDARRSSELRFHELCNRVLPDRYLSEHPRQPFLSHKAQGIWFDMFQFLFCERRGVLPPDFDGVDFLAERAARRRSDVAAVAASIGGTPDRRRPPVADQNRRPASVRPVEERNGAAGLVEERLSSIMQAVGGRNVRTNGEELSFATESTNGLEIRLAANLEGRCYDRSANFAISYGGGPSDELPSSGFHAVVDRIKAVDDSPIADVATLFKVAAALVAGVSSNGGTGGEAESTESERNAVSGTMPSHAPLVSGSLAQVGLESIAPYSEARWERHRTRKLNVVFLDLCAQLIGRHGQPLSPLHWGFWPTASSAPAVEADAYDPFEAFSENLLAYIPDDATRILDVGCGLGVNARLLAARNKLVTAVSPVAHHCAVIEDAKVPGVEVTCARFEEMSPVDRYDLLLFSESVNHFPLDDEFFEHCATFLTDSGFMLMADDLNDERAARIAAQRVFRVVRSADISENVAPTGHWWAEHMRAFAAYRAALMSILDMHDASAATRVRQILDVLDSSDLRLLLSGQTSPPVSKGRYLIYLLQLD